MDIEAIREFQSDYYKGGKFNLQIQAEHLAKLAKHYRNRYGVSGKWRDCLKVCHHVLSNGFGLFQVCRRLGGVDSQLQLQPHVTCQSKEGRRVVCNTQSTEFCPAFIFC